jgi:hypothetical protein
MLGTGHPIKESTDRADDQAMEKVQKKQRVVRPPTLSLPATRSISIPMQPLRDRVDEESSCGTGFGVTARRGRRRPCREDMYIALPVSCSSHRPEPLSIFAVLDGHGGHKASKFASERLSQIISSCSDLSTPGIQKALRNAFLQTDAEFMESGTGLKSSTSRTEYSRTKSGSRFASVALQKGLSRDRSIDNLQILKPMRLGSSSEGLPSNEISHHSLEHQFRLLDDLTQEQIYLQLREAIRGLKINCPARQPVKTETAVPPLRWCSFSNLNYLWHMLGIPELFSAMRARQYD